MSWEKHNKVKPFRRFDSYGKAGLSGFEIFCFIILVMLFILNIYMIIKMLIIK